MIFARPSKTARARMFTLALARPWATWASVPGLFASWTVNCLARGISSPPEDLPAQPENRIVEAVHDTLLQRNYGVVGDADALRTDLRAAAGNVAHPGTQFAPDC